MGFLTDLVGDLRRRLERDPLDESGLLAIAMHLPPPRPFDGAVRGTAVPVVIAEYKRSSPSAGSIADPDVASQARAYAEGGAAVISVLTEPTRFDGALADLRAVRLAVDLPVLRKDFLVHPAQVIESRAAAADAVLLIAAALSELELKGMLAVAADLGLGTLVETHSEEDLAKALASDAPVIGVNARALETYPDERGRFGAYGGRYVPEVLIPALDELAAAWSNLRDDPAFRGELDALLRDFVGRPSAMTFASRLSEATGYRIYLKREDLNHTGAHKINNTLGQVLVARRLGKGRIIAETGAGMHGAASVVDTHYVLGSVAGPDPFPALVRDLQRVIGDEARVQLREREGRDPDVVVACVGGGSNAIGIFEAFLPEPSVGLVGVEAGGRGDGLGEHCRSLTLGEPGVLHGSYSYLLQDEQGQVVPTHSISAGLDYPGVGPEHAFLKDAGRATYVSVTDGEALEGFRALATLEGILPALEPAHAIGWLLRRPLAEGSLVLVNLSGRGDKDLETVQAALGSVPGAPRA